jgi:hypothetical protein
MTYLARVERSARTYKKNRPSANLGGFSMREI